MQLTIGERLNLLGILPNQSDIITLKKIKDLADQLNFSDEETKEYGITVKDDRYIWSKESDEKTKDIKIGEICEKEITTILKKKNDDRELEINMISLYEKIVEKKFKNSKKEKDAKPDSVDESQ